MMSDHKSKMPENYNALFGYKSQPQGNVKAYPPFAEVKKNFQAAREALINAAKAASDKSLEQPLGEKGGGFATDGLDALLKGAWHEGWHAGQIAEVRKALGLKPSM